MPFTSLPESSMNKMKNQKKESKMGDTVQCPKERQDTSTLSNSSSQKKKLKRRAAKEADENCPPQGMNDATDSRQSPDHLPLKAKKSKKTKRQATSQVQSSNRSLSSIELHQSTPQDGSGGETQKSGNVEATTDLKCKGAPIKDNEISQRRRKPPLSLDQSNMRNSTPLSSPTTLLPKGKKETKINCPDKTEAMNGMSDDSQDLFITQKKFLPSHGSSIEDSLPLAQKQGSGLLDWLKSPEPLHLLSELTSPMGNSHYLSSIRSNQQIVLRDKATQTDDRFTYLVMMSYLKKVKVLEPCLEKALDLSLPSRIRAKKKVVLSANNDLLIVESQSTPAPSKKYKTSLRFSPRQKLDTTKFVQTELNSNYFFKGKGENGEATTIAPLIKGKERSKRKSRKYKKER